MQTAPKDKNLDILGKLLKQFILIVMGEMDEEDLPLMEDVKEAAKAFNAHKSAWTEPSQKKSPIEERVMALEEIVKKNLADPARNATPGVATGMPQLRTHASVVAPQMTKTAVRIRINGADKLQLQELLSRVQFFFKSFNVYAAI